MTSYLLSIDPGKSTGIALWAYEEETPAELVRAWQFDGGLTGFLRWWRDEQSKPDYPHNITIEQMLGDDPVPDVSFVSEKFTPLQNKGFNLTLDSVEPLRIEGALVALGLLPDYGKAVPSWQRPAEMYWVPGKNATEKRRNQVAWVKERFPELHLTGKDVSAPDADDARSAIWHGMVWLRKNHLPSAKHWFGGDDA